MRVKPICIAVLWLGLFINSRCVDATTQVVLFRCTPHFWSYESDFFIAAFSTFCKVLIMFQVSATFGSWAMILFSRHFTAKKKRFTLSYASSVSGAKLLPYLLYFVNSPSLVSQVSLEVTAGSTSGFKVNLGQLYYFDLTSSFQFDLPRSNWNQGGHKQSPPATNRGTQEPATYRVNSAFFLSGKLFAKTVHIKIVIFFTLTRPGEVKIRPKEVNSGTAGLRTSQEFV